MVLVIDNFDSFAHNLARYFRLAGQKTLVVRSDAIDPRQAQSLRPVAIVLSPGPCGPEQAGCTVAVVRELSGKIPILGVCLGCQAIGHAFGGRVVRAPAPVHGSASEITHEGSGPLRSLPSPLGVGRYHSLIVQRETLPASLRCTATTDTGLVMALEHVEHPTYGLQFHPESVLTPDGAQMIHSFLAIADRFWNARETAPQDAA